jgi:hypothetical protein
MVETEGYLLRIATDQWVDQVFSIAAYYTGLRRKWKPDQTTLFVHKTDAGDAVVGYGLIENFHGKDEMSKEERLECEKHGWSSMIEYRYVVRFKKPILLKETFLKDLKLHGRYFHGLKLRNEQLQAVIALAEQIRR